MKIDQSKLPFKMKWRSGVINAQGYTLVNVDHQETGEMIALALNQHNALANALAAALTFIETQNARIEWRGDDDEVLGEREIKEMKTIHLDGIVFDLAAARELIK